MTVCHSGGGEVSVVLLVAGSAELWVLAGIAASGMSFGVHRDRQFCKPTKKSVLKIVNFRFAGDNPVPGTGQEVDRHSCNLAHA